MSRFLRLAFSFAFALVALLTSRAALAQDLILDGAAVGPVVCPGGGTAVNRLCNVSATPAQNNACMYGGQHTFNSVVLTNGATVCVAPYDGADPVNTGNLVLVAPLISVDATSRITAKGSGYQGALCADGAGPTAASGGKGGCSVQDSGGGGAHFGSGGRGTKDCFIFGSATSCQFPQEWEEDCGNLNAAGNACLAPPAGCYNLDANPTVAGQGFKHDIFDVEFGAAGGDKGCSDGDGFATTVRAGDGGGRIVLVATTPSQDGQVMIAGRITTDGKRGCSAGNDSAGGGGGGTILVQGDFVSVEATARISAHGGRGGDSQPKCLPCTVNTDCQAPQTCQAGRCTPCNCTPCTATAQCDALLGQTCQALGGALGSVCVGPGTQCTPFDPADEESECVGTQNSGTCDDCGGGGGGGIINVQSRIGAIDPEAIFDVRGAAGGICPICAGEAGGGAGELQIDSGYVGEICDGWDNDFDGMADEGLPDLTCPDGTMIPSCVAGVPQLCDYSDPSLCLVTATDARPRFLLVVDTSGSMLNDLGGTPTFGDGSATLPGVDTASDPDAIAGNNSRLFVAKEALTQVLSAFPESDYALARYYQDVGVNRSCQTASNFECASSCCSYDDPSNNTLPLYPSGYPGNQCVLGQLYPGAGYPATSAFTGNMPIGWVPVAAEDPPTPDCINYAGSCGPPRRGSQVLVDFNQPINRYLEWLDGVEDADAAFDSSTVEGDHCPAGNCELRGTGPTPLTGALQASYDYLTPAISCDSAKDCRSYSVILLTDGAESCETDPAAPAAAASDLFVGIAGKPVQTYVIGFSVLATEEAQLDQIAAAGGTTSAFFASNKSELADALAEIIGQNQKFELCNDLDDDCDNLIDEDFPAKGLMCTDGLLGACAGTGVYVCTADGSDTECVITNPGAAPMMEICNNLDDDCDGLVDEDDMGLPLDCMTCMGLEICDGLDNDCDFAVDEEPDVSMNQPDIFGLPCGELIAPNNQLPCQFGVVQCINAMPICIGFVGPGEEICNGLDDNCDGVADDLAACPAETECVRGNCLAPCQGGEFPCAVGYVCERGYCVAEMCGDDICSANERCVNGRCVGDDPSGAGGTGGSGGSGGSGGGQAGAGGSSADSTSSAGVTSTGDYGLATGGGGCSCRTASGASSSSWVFAAGAAISAWIARRRSRREQARSARPRSAGRRVAGGEVQR